MTTLLISDTAFSIYYFDFPEDIPYLFHQAFNLGKLISRKHNNKDTNWKTTQEQRPKIL